MNAPVDLLGVTLEERKAAVKRRARAIRLSEPLPNPKYRVLSLGVGLQSVVIALKSARGDLPLLDLAIFADTGGEKRRTYEYLDWLERHVPFPIIRATRAGPSLADYVIETTGLPIKGRQHPPFFTANPDGMLPKQCSKEWKTRVVHRVIREQLLGLAPGEQGPREPIIEQWLGMTIDELHRISTSEKRYIHQHYPLIADEMHRRDCIPWLEQRQLPIPPKSSCKFCPFQRDDQWLDMQLNDPEDFAEAVAFDTAIRPGHLGFEGQCFLHRSRMPLGEIDFTRPIDRDQDQFAFDGAIGCGDGECGV